MSPLLAQTVTKTSTFTDKYGNVGEGEDKWTITFDRPQDETTSLEYNASSGLEFYRRLGGWDLTSERFFTSIQSVVVRASIGSGASHLIDFKIDGEALDNPYFIVNKSTSSNYTNTFTGYSPALNGHLSIRIRPLGDKSLYIKSISVTYTPTANEQTVALDETSDNCTLLSSSVATDKTVTVNLKRALTADMWNAICLPFSMSTPQQTELFGEGYSLKEFTSVDETDGISLKFTTVKGSTVAGKPYIVLPKKTIARNEAVSISGVAITDATPGTTSVTGENGTYTYQGIYAPTVIEKNNMRYRFIGANNKLYYSTSDNPMRAFRCFFTLPETSAASNVSLGIDEDGVATNISAAEVQGLSIGADRVYTVTGQYIGPKVPQEKGIYIVDGKKILVR